MNHNSVKQNQQRALLLVFLFLSSVITHAESGSMVPRFKGYHSSPYGFWEYLPDGYNINTKYPLVIYLHGIKETGNGENAVELQKVLKAGPTRLICRKFKEFPFILIAPQSPGLPEGFHHDNLRQLIKILKANYSVDEDRIYITGISYGAYATWNAGMELTDELAAIIPISSCGGVLDHAKLKNIPVWAFVNRGDWKTVPRCTREVIEEIRQLGGTPLLTSYEQKGHNAWTRTYMDDRVWAWLLAQRRTKQNQPPALVCPENIVSAAGRPLRLEIMASDPNNDSLFLTLSSPLPIGFELKQTSNGQAIIESRSAFTGSYTFSITVKNQKGYSASKTFVVEVTYGKMLLSYLLLLTFQPMLMTLGIIEPLWLQVIFSALILYLFLLIKHLMEKLPNRLLREPLTRFMAH